MKRVWVWGHVLTGVSLLSGVVVAGAIASACVHDDSTIFVSQVLAPPLVTAGMACTFTADPTQPSLSSGVLDADLSSTYSPEFLVGNQIVPRGNPNQPDTETSIVTIQGAVVRILDSSGKQLNTFTRTAGITIPPSSGTTAGYAALQVTILDQDTVATLDLATGGGTIRVVSYVRFFGKTLGGDSVESDEFGFPIDVCRSCLISFPASEDEARFPTPNCALGGSSSSTSTSVPCIVGQDFPIDCSLCQE
ncbi:MAG TPA: hypothetical protein VH044_00850, partial [Polyangiaceae bacterium]|nr:hypothetical protein [Polyangiaceae bacterium]